MNLLDSFGAVANLGGSNPSGAVSSLVESGVNFIPGVGPLLSGFAGQVAGSITRFIGGNPRVPFGKEANDAAPHRQEGYLDMSAFAQDNGNEYARWALENNCTVEDIEGANGYERRISGHSWEQVVAWWRNHPETLQYDLKGFFAENPRLKGAGPVGAFPTSAAVLPSYLPTRVPLSTSESFASGLGFAGGGVSPKFTYSDALSSPPQPASSLTAMELLKAALDGAKTGVTGKVLDTPEGRKATDQGALEFLKNRWYIPLALVVVITGLLVAVLTGRRR